MVKYFLFIFAFAAYAKPVVLEWETSPNASDYELRIEQSGNEVFHGHIKDDHWKGDLKPGLYSYRLRGFERSGRPGQWSDEATLAVLAAAPRRTLPAEKYVFYADEQHREITLKWDSGSEWVHLRVVRDAKVIVDEVLQAEQYVLGALEPGKYEWQLASALKSSKGAQTWNGEPGSSTFEVKKLALAEDLTPRGAYESVEAGLVRFSWDEVEGADRYEIKFTRLSRGREVAEAKNKKVKATSTEFVVRPGEKYLWQVRAIAANGAVTDAPPAELSVVLPENYKRRDKLSPELRLTQTTYKEQRTHSSFAIDQGSVELGGKLGWNFWGRVSLVSTPSLTLVPMRKQNQAEIRIGRADARLGYDLLAPEAPWQLRPEIGGAYVKMWVSPKAYGVNKLSGPQIELTVARRMNNHGDLLQLHLRTGWISDEFGFLGHSHTAMAELGYWRDRWKLSLQYEKSKLNLGSENARLQTLSLGAGYGF